MDRNASNMASNTTTKAIVGEKIGMTQVWDDDNRIVPVTMVKVEPCRVVQIKTPETDGYSAVQVTYGRRDPRKLTKPKAGHYAKAGVDPGVRLVELRLADTSAYSIGMELNAALLNAGELVDVTGVSKGKGFAGVMKRHNFAGQRASHGAHKVHRKPGAVGACATPARIFKGQRMAGRMGGERVTTLNLEIVKADIDNDVVLVKGSVPGPRGGVVVIRNAVKGPEVEAPDFAALSAPPEPEEAPAEEAPAEEVAAEEAPAEAAVEEAAPAEAEAEAPAEEAPAAEEAAEEAAPEEAADDETDGDAEAAAEEGDA